MNLFQTTYDAVGTSKGSALVFLICSTVIYQLGVIIYNLYFHPLRKYPGPLLCRASPLPWAYFYATGVLLFRAQKWHKQYGHVVRLGPNHLSYTDARALREIYGHRIAVGSQEISKADAVANSIEALPRHIINAERDEHQRLRRALSHGFSDGAIRSQEPIIARHVDRLVAGLRQEAVASSAAADGSPRMLNMEAWMNWTTFDVVGELVFGLSFGSLKSLEYHPWVIFMIRQLKESAVLAGLHYIGLGWVNTLLYKTTSTYSLKKVFEHTDRMLEHRLENEPECQDLFEGLVKKQAEWGLTFDNMSANAMILILAGSETTATLLSGCIYLLLSNPEKLEMLQREVRSTYKSDGDITLNNVNDLTFMLAVLNESLRLYPPVPSSLVRVVPAGGETIMDDFIPGGMYVECHQWSMARSADNWESPSEFRPERFLGNNEKDVLESLQPFGIGARSCLGRNLAYVEMRFILARLIFNFDMRLDDSSKQWIERQRAYPLWSRIPLGVYLQPR